MPPVSPAQNRAMYAAASGRSTLGIPVSVANEFIGQGGPKGLAKKKTRRGRKPSVNPLNQHHTAFNQAHAAGNHAAARIHALNYANASAKLSSASSANPAMTEPDADQMGGPSDQDADNPPMATPKAMPSKPMPKPPMSMARMALAKRTK